MSDDDGSHEPQSGKKKKAKTKRVLRRTNTAPMKASKKNNQQPSITLPQMENNFASQFHTLGDDEDTDPARTAQQQQMERKLAKLRSKTRLNQRRSAPTTPRGGSFNRNNRAQSHRQPQHETKKSGWTFGRSQTDIDDAFETGFEDPFFTADPFADFPNEDFSFSSPELMTGSRGGGGGGAPATAFSAPNAVTYSSSSSSSAAAVSTDPLPVAVAATASQSYTQPLAKPTPTPPLRASNSNPSSRTVAPPIANEKLEPSTVPLAPPAVDASGGGSSGGGGGPVPKRGTTRSKRSNTLPTLSMSNTPNASAPVAVTTDEREIRLDFDPFDTVERPPLKNDDSSDLTMFYSYSAPASRRTSQSAVEQRPYVPYVHPAGVDTSGRSSLVYVPVQVPVYNVAGGVPYVNGRPAQAAVAGQPVGPPGYVYQPTATGGQWVQPQQQQYPQQAQQYPAQQYPMTPPANAQQWTR